MSKYLKKHFWRFRLHHGRMKYFMVEMRRWNYLRVDEHCAAYFRRSWKMIPLKKLITVRFPVEPSHCRFSGSLGQVIWRSTFHWEVFSVGTFAGYSCTSYTDRVHATEYASSGDTYAYNSFSFLTLMREDEIFVWIHFTEGKEEEILSG